MRLFTSIFVLLLLASMVLLPSCSKDDILQEQNSPDLAAYVDGCEVAGPYNDYMPGWNSSGDINTVLNNCFTEDPGQGCGNPGISSVESYNFSYVRCPEPAYKVNIYINQMVTQAINGRPKSVYSAAFNTRCTWRITGFNFVYVGTQNDKYAFRLDVTYTQECCPHRDLIGIADTPTLEPHGDDDNGEWAFHITPSESFAGSGFQVTLTDPNAQVQETGMAERIGETNTFMYWPDQDNLATRGTIVLEGY